MRPHLPPVPGLVDALPELVESLTEDLSSRNVMRVAEALWRVGQTARAVELLAPLTERDRSAIAPHVLLGWCYEDTGQPDKAFEAFRLVYELDPANPYARAHVEADVAAEATIPPPRDPETATEEAVTLEEPMSTAAELELEAEPEEPLSDEELREVPPGPLYSKTLGDIFEKQGFDQKAQESYAEIKRRGLDQGDEPGGDEES
jgi:tetratricopeptide (TPR) repeat protein